MTLLICENRTFEQKCHSVSTQVNDYYKVIPVIFWIVIFGVELLVVPNLYFLIWMLRAIIGNQRTSVKFLVHRWDPDSVISVFSRRPDVFTVFFKILWTLQCEHTVSRNRHPKAKIMKFVIFIVFFKLCKIAWFDRFLFKFMIAKWTPDVLTL